MTHTHIPHLQKHPRGTKKRLDIGVVVWFNSRVGQSGINDAATTQGMLSVIARGRERQQVHTKGSTPILPSVSLIRA